MNKIKILSAISAGLMCSQVMAYGYDSTGDQALTGGAQLENHSFNSVAGPCGGNLACTAVFVDNAEVMASWTYSNHDFQEDGTTVIGTRNYDSTVPTGNLSWNVVDVYFPACNDSLLNVPGGTQACTRQLSAGAATAAGKWNIDVAPNGKMLDGYLSSNTALPTGDIMGIGTWTDGSMDRFCMFLGVTSDLSTAEADDIESGAQTCEAIGTSNANLIFLQDLPASYLTADSADLQITKAVPVPAFASAALGLMLAGLAFQTGNRRKTK